MCHSIKALNTVVEPSQCVDKYLLVLSWQCVCRCLALHVSSDKSAASLAVRNVGSSPCFIMGRQRRQKAWHRKSLQRRRWNSLAIIRINVWKRSREMNHHNNDQFLLWITYPVFISTGQGLMCLLNTRRGRMSRTYQYHCNGVNWSNCMERVD